MRPGRLDRILYVSPPDLESRREIFRVNFAKMAVHGDVDINELAQLVSIWPRSHFVNAVLALIGRFPRRTAVLALSSSRFAKMPR